MVTCYDYIFIVHDDHDKLYVYDEGGILKRSVEIYCKNNKCKMIIPRGICLVQCGIDTRNLVISDHNGKCLWWLTTEIQAGDLQLGQPQLHKLQYRPWGLSTDRLGRAVVTDYSSSRVYVNSYPGQRVTCQQLPGGRGVKPEA